MNLDSASVRRIAEALLASPRVGDEVARTEGRLVTPVEIRSPTGEVGGWVVGVEIGGRLLGFIQLDSRGEMRRYVSLRERHGSVGDCPSTGSWLDPDTIAERAGELARTDERVGVPVLTWDRHPDRTVWEVALNSASGTRVIQVMGEYVGVRPGP